MVLNHFYAKTSLSHLRILSPTSSFQIWFSLQFALQPIFIFLYNFHKNLEMLVEEYNSFLCKNPLVFFGKIEQNILFCSLVQFGIFYCNPILSCPIAHEISPAISIPYQTLKSRRLDPLEYFWSMQ